MSSPHRFVVRRQVWTPPDAAGIRRLLPEKWERVAECRTADDAYAKCAALTADARRTLNPFHLGGPALFYQTSLPAFALHDFLLDADVTPPANSLSSSPTYPFWWVKNNRTFTPEQRDRVWAACDKLILFDVIEEDDREAAHVVVEYELARLPWYDELQSLMLDGGIVRSVHRSKRVANRAARILQELRREEAAEADLDDPEHVNVVGVSSVPLTGGLPSGVCHLVTRPGWAEGGEIEGQAVRKPLVALANPTSTADHRSTLIRRARRGVNPFRTQFRNQISGRALGEEWEDNNPELPNGLSFDDALEAVRKLPTPIPAPSDDTAEAWAAWYDRVVQWSPEYVDVIWGTFADFRLFEVIEVPLG